MPISKDDGKFRPEDSINKNDESIKDSINMSPVIK